jgi:hypothetical protein
MRYYGRERIAPSGFHNEAFQNREHRAIYPGFLGYLPEAFRDNVPLGISASTADSAIHSHDGRL